MRYFVYEVLWYEFVKYEVYIKYKYIERDHTHDTRKNITIRIFVYEVVYIYTRVHIFTTWTEVHKNIIFLNFNQKHAFTTKKKI